MIIVHQDNLAAFGGGHTYLWLPQQMMSSRSVTTTGVPAVITLVERLAVLHLPLVTAGAKHANALSRKTAHKLLVSERVEV